MSRVGQNPMHSDGVEVSIADGELTAKVNLGHRAFHCCPSWKSQSKMPSHRKAGQ